ncbi:HAD family hydrolase [Sporolactobacillus shoreicorticis]|uniref:HAD-IIB family hydrolase n=1 Tax=Sporolactobacillus shoreicorticis TaxID=1923877 RepID=A0ABW5S1Z8_9BACL|nr:HAD-IIB family hydrolase [Sporolactobacillus shoreicorticis]MCO7125389.1 HAD family hydrolase [Sporolactobacillus shoreicorticis]
MKTLYVSDLDGTLLNSQSKLSEYSTKTLNRLTEDGTAFTYATARSLISASVVTKNLRTPIPVIIYNGASIVDTRSGRRLDSASFNKQGIREVAEWLTERQTYPLVYAFIDGVEHVSWLKGYENDGMLHYLHSRKGDPRLRSVTNIHDLYAGDVFYFTCIGDQDPMTEIHQRFSRNGRYQCIVQQELYRQEYWCELMPAQATKANAIVRLKKIMGFDRIVSFGDRVNDLSMFSISDEAYAVENAVDELKERATGIIKSNDDDGVARWLDRHVHSND